MTGQEKDLSIKANPNARRARQVSAPSICFSFMRKDMYMAEQLPDPTTSVKGTEERPPSIPRWLKISGIITIVLILLFVTLHLTGNGMGPGMHTGSSMQMPSTEQDTQRP